MSGRRRRRPVVLQSVRPPTATTNPYVVQLVDACRELTDVDYFRWRRGILGRYDVLHVHWPEVMLRREGRTARLAAQLRFATLMLRVTVTRTPVVRTLHNAAAHEPGSRWENLLLTWCERLTRHWILLNPATPVPRPAPSRVIPHGHYRDWYPVTGRAQVPGRVLHFGLIRPYKGLDVLLQAFRALPDPAASLRIVGRPTTPQLRALVEDACAADPRISSRLDHVDDAGLAQELEEAQLVALPYRNLHNSGALLLALSLDRPVLVPDGVTSRAMAAEVGPGWVLTVDGTLDAPALREALAATVRRPPGRPELSGRDWPAVAQAHLEVYRAAWRGAP
ncbi:MAG TPA: glycosyltransferase [Kineosporiaceae bacterium]|nr:glycosyltransferase [Kineosporiaceae bacterium]